MSWTYTTNSDVDIIANERFFCKDCGEYVFSGGPVFKSGVIVHVCTCNSMLKVSKKSKTKKVDLTDYRFAIKKGREYICPACGRTLLFIQPEKTLNIAFTAECQCGFHCRNGKTIDEINRFSESEVRHYITLLENFLNKGEV